MLSPAFQVLEVNPSLFERAISLSSSDTICNLIVLGLPWMGFLQATQYTLDLLGILKTTSVKYQNFNKDLRISAKKSNTDGIAQCVLGYRRVQTGDRTLFCRTAVPSHGCSHQPVRFIRVELAHHAEECLTRFQKIQVKR